MRIASEVDPTTRAAGSARVLTRKRSKSSRAWSPTTHAECRLHPRGGNHSPSGSRPGGNSFVQGNGHGGGSMP